MSLKIQKKLYKKNIKKIIWSANTHILYYKRINSLVHWKFNIKLKIADCQKERSVNKTFVLVLFIFIKNGEINYPIF